MIKRSRDRRRFSNISPIGQSLSLHGGAVSVDAAIRVIINSCTVEMSIQSSMIITFRNAIANSYLGQSEKLLVCINTPYQQIVLQMFEFVLLTQSYVLWQMLTEILLSFLGFPYRNRNCLFGYFKSFKIALCTIFQIE